MPEVRLPDPNREVAETNLVHLYKKLRSKYAIAVRRFQSEVILCVSIDLYSRRFLHICFLITGEWQLVRHSCFVLAKLY